MAASGKKGGMGRLLNRVAGGKYRDAYIPICVFSVARFNPNGSKTGQNDGIKKVPKWVEVHSS